MQKSNQQQDKSTWTHPFRMNKLKWTQIYQPEGIQQRQILGHDILIDGISFRVWNDYFVH